jgi:hypothetical protein
MRRRTSLSLNADNAIDDLIRSLAGVRLTRTATPTLTMHRHGLDLSSHTRTTSESKAGAWLAHKWLGHAIQDHGPGGHDPEEDAQALWPCLTNCLPTCATMDYLQNKRTTEYQRHPRCGTSNASEE